MRGIYKITNKINNKVYIGESMNILKRWREHKEDLNNKHHSYKLQTDWNKYSINEFDFSLVAVIDDDIKDFVANYLLIIYENYYMKLYNSINSGYNVENTLNEILNKKKHVFDKKDDINILKQYIHYVNDKIYCNESGIIYQNSFDLKKIAKYFNITNNELKKILVNLNICKRGVKDIQFDELIVSNDSIIRNGTFSKVKFDKIAYDNIINNINNANLLNINKSLSKPNKTKNDYKSKTIKEPKIKNNKESIDITMLPVIPEDEILDFNESLTGYYPMKEIVDSLKINDTYNNILANLRKANILEYKQYRNKSINTLAINDKDLYIYLKKYGKTNNTPYVMLYFSESGRDYIIKKVLELYKQYKTN